MTQLAPVSRSISAAMSPVWAPLGLAWQSWPPIATLEPVSACDIQAISVAGGHSSTSQARPSAASATGRAMLPSWSAMPFIFQLPAISCRIDAVPPLPCDSPVPG